jgi:ABC-2 type transport system permease protein
VSALATNTRVVMALGARSVKQTFHRPQLVAPILVFPTLLLAVQTGGAGSAVDIPGFPEVKNFLSFMLAGAMLQACLLAGNTGGIALAVDLEMGFTDRLFAAPISRYAIVAGRLAGTAVLGAATALWFIAIGLIFGASFEQGVPGMLLMVVFTALAAVAFGGISAAIALYTGTASVVQGLFPLIFVILFLSSAFFPANLLLEPARSISDWNPMSFIAEGIRDPIVSDISAEPVLKGVAAVAGVMALGAVLSMWGLRRRLAS